LAHVPRRLRRGERGLKYPIMEMRMLTNAWTGIYTVWTWYSDGTMEEHRAPLGRILIPAGDGNGV
jgi:hypothetical protein